MSTRPPLNVERADKGEMTRLDSLLLSFRLPASQQQSRLFLLHDPCGGVLLRYPRADDRGFGPYDFHRRHCQSLVSCTVSYAKNGADLFMQLVDHILAVLWRYYSAAAATWLLEGVDVQS